MAELMMGLAEAAHRLRVPYQNCHRLLLTGVLRGVKRDGRWYVYASDVETLANRRATTVAEKGEDEEW